LLQGAPRLAVRLHATEHIVDPRRGRIIIEIVGAYGRNRGGGAYRRPEAADRRNGSHGWHSASRYRPEGKSLGDERGEHLIDRHVVLFGRRLRLIVMYYA